MTLPERRIIESVNQRCDVPEDYAEAIQKAINTGEQINCFTRGSAVETCLTQFTDPLAEETRWAVEVWSQSRKWTRDYSTESAALTYQQKERHRLHINGRV